MQALDWQLAVLVDEAHNLVERARQMYSAELGLQALQAAASLAPAAVQGPLQLLVQATQDLVLEQATPYAVLADVPDAYTQALQAAAGSLGEHFLQHPLAVGPLLNFHFEL